MNATNVYWVKQVVLYRLEAKDPTEAMKKFRRRKDPDTYLHEVQEEELFRSTGRWTTEKVLITEDE